MLTDIEETLVRELREVADDLHVPAMPPLPEEPPRSARWREPMLVAAAVVLIAAGAVGVATLPGGLDTEPAQPSPAPSPVPSPSPSPTESNVPVPRTAPALPYVLEDRLYVDGEQVPGSWWAVHPAGEAWIAVADMPPTWWWGRGSEPQALPNGEDVTPQISANGRYVAVVRAEGGEGVLTVLDTRSGDPVGDTPLSIGSQRWDYPAYVVAVLDDGRVVVRREDSHLLWLPGAGGSTVDLSETAPGQVVLGSTSAGLVVTDGDGGQPYLAEVTDEYELTRVGELPQHDDLVVSPGATWVAWTPIGTTGGEVNSIPSLEVSRLDGTNATTLNAPDGWQLATRTYVWENEDHLVSTVVDDRGRERMARCSPVSSECVLIERD